MSKTTKKTSTNRQQSASSLVANPAAGEEIAVAYGAKDVTTGYLLGDQIVYSQDNVLRTQGNDLQIYTEILRDDQVKACFDQRRSAVVSAELQVEPGGSSPIDIEAADFLKAQLDKIGFDKITDKMLYCVFYGLSVAEIIYEVGDKYLEWAAIKSRNPRRFRFTAGGELRLRTTQGGEYGDAAPSPYFWHISSGGEFDDQYYGKGLGHWCYWPVKFKRNGIKYWMIYSEKYGSPTIVGKFPFGATPDASRALLLQAAQAAASDSAVIIPDNMTLDLLQSAWGGSADYEQLCKRMDEAISKAIVGQTMTTDKGGSHAQSKTHHAVRQDIIKSDSDLICEGFNRGPVAWLIGENFPNAQLPRVFRVVEEPQDLNLLSERDQRLFSIGYRPTLEQVAESYGDGYEPIPIQAQPANTITPGAIAPLPGVSANPGSSATGES